jgi:hypothetical protein
MEEAQPPQVSESLSPPMSLTDRLMSVFVSPAEVFDEIKTSPPNSANWVVPLVCAMMVGIIYSLVVFSQPGIIQNMKDATEKKMQESVAAGKMTQQQADQAQETVGKIMNPGVFKVVGILSSIFINTGLLFLVALIIWLLGKYGFHGDFGYMQAVETVSLSGMIYVMGGVVSMLLAVIYGNMSMTPGPVLLVGRFDPANKVHLILSAVNLISLWYVGILALGLARLSGAGFGKSAVWLYGLWAVFTIGPIWLFGGR